MAERKSPEWASTDIIDIGNGDPNKRDPGPDKQESGWAVEKPKLQHMNWIMNLFGKYLKSNNHINKSNDGEELEAGDRKIADNSISSPTMFLPSSPLDGQWVEIGGVDLYSKFPVFVNGGTKDIMITDDKICELDKDSDNAIFRFWWDEAAVLWKIRQVEIAGVVE
jgi:hypothetical protein